MPTTLPSLSQAHGKAPSNTSTFTLPPMNERGGGGGGLGGLDRLALSVDDRDVDEEEEDDMVSKNLFILFFLFPFPSSM